MRVWTWGRERKYLKQWKQTESSSVGFPKTAVSILARTDTNRNTQTQDKEEIYGAKGKESVSHTKKGAVTQQVKRKGKKKSNSSFSDFWCFAVVFRRNTKRMDDQGVKGMKERKLMDSEKPRHNSWQWKDLTIVLKKERKPTTSREIQKKHNTTLQYRKQEGVTEHR